MTQSFFQACTGAVLVLVLAACATETGPLSMTLDVTETMTPADSVSGEPYLYSSEGRTYLSWIDRGAEGDAMRFAESEGDGWSAPRTIATGDGWFVNWADVPSIAAAGNEMWAHWLEYNGTGRYAYGARVASSQDGGVSWSEPVWLHEDTTAAEHGFATIAALDDGFRAVWLDGRNWADGLEEMTVQARQLGQTLGEEHALDVRSCECCPTDMVAVGGQTLVVAYRDRAADETRNINIVRFVDGAWQEPYPLHEDGWQIHGCPVNGPALASAGQTVVAAWFTAPEQSPQVRVAFSNDAGATFGDPIRVDTGAAIGRVDIVLLDDGSAIASWIAGSDQAGIIARRVSPDGRMSEPTTVVATSAARSSGYPRMVRQGQELVFAWTGTEPTRHVKTARATVSL